MSVIAIFQQLTVARNCAARVGVQITVLRLSSILCAVLIVSVNAFSQVPGPRQPPQTEKFVWRYGGHELGTLAVPRGFTAETENYREGIVTRLRYPDGSCFVLQRGFMYRIPLFQDPEHILDSSEKISGKTVRRGHYSDKPEVWGEVWTMHPGNRSIPEPRYSRSFHQT